MSTPTQSPIPISQTPQVEGRKNPKVLVIPSSYPETHAPHNGIFFREQVRALHGSGANIGVIYPEMRSLRTIPSGKLWESRFQEGSYEEQGVPTYRIHGWNLPRPPLARTL